MNDSSSTAETGGFDPGRLRTAPMQMLRSRDDRYVAGVCGGLARYLNIDPVVVRVLVAAFTVVGGVGLVLYGAAWLLTPEEGSTRNILEDHLPLRPSHRVLAWIVAAVIAVGAVVGSGPWFDWGWIGPLPLLGLAVLIWLLARPRQSSTPPAVPPPGPPGPASTAAMAAPSQTGPTTSTAATPTAPDAETATDAPPAPAVPDAPPAPDAPADEAEPGAAPTAAADDTTVIQTTADIAEPTEPTTPIGPPSDTPPATAPGPGSAAPKLRGGGALTWLTLAAAVVVIGVVWLVDQSGTDVDGPVYVAASLAVVGLGMLAGTWWGNGRWLIPFGAILTGALIMVSQLPVWKAGEIKEAPTQSAYVRSSYEMGAGRIELDLTNVQDLAALDGRTITIENGLGEIKLAIPENIDAEIDAEINLGQVEVLGRQVGGSDASTRYADFDDADPNVHFDISGSLGNVEVTRP